MRIRMRNDTFILDPPMPQARAYFFTQLHKQIEIICGLKRIEAFRYTKYKGFAGKRDNTYRGLLKQMKNYNIVDAYDSISSTVSNAENYFKLWKQYQSLWDLQSTQIYDMLGDQVDKWTQLLNEIRSGRKTFDGSDDKKVFGAIAISYGAVKGDVTTKYDLWHREILKKFGNQVSIAMKALKKEIYEARSKLEALSIDAQDDVTTFVTEIQDIRRKVKGWEKGIQRMKKGEALLKGQRFQFPNDWPWLSVLEYEWSESF